MRIIPVIDVRGGVVVRAVAGRRSEYRPWVSRLTASADPVSVARALLAVTGSAELYVADLDAICGGPPTVDPTRFPATVLLDAGLRSPAQLARIQTWANARAVVGTETWEAAPDTWPRPFPAILSLDLYRGVLRCGWGEAPEIETVLARRVPMVIVLDIARVGLRRGIGTEAMVRRIKRAYPATELIAGGGVKDGDDIARLEQAGADGVLVATALHDGSLFGKG